VSDREREVRLALMQVKGALMAAEANVRHALKYLQRLEEVLKDD